MCRSPLTFIVMAFSVMLLIGLPHRAVALDHVSALRSGDLVMDPAVLRVPESAGMVTYSGRHAAVISELFSSPHSPSQLKAYKDALDRMSTPAGSSVLKAYAKLISALPLDRVLLADAKREVRSVSWIKGGNAVSLCRESCSLNADAMKRITASSGKDAVVFIKPVVVFSPDFSRIYLIERLDVFAWGPVHSFYMGSDTLHKGLMLLDTKPDLRVNGIQGLAASNGIGENVIRARIAVWFANHGRRLMQAIKMASKSLALPLSSYLQGHS